MIKRLLNFLVLLLLLSPAVFAHRLNEYLEATTISLTRGNVFFELRLTPGVDVAKILLKAIDLNHDNRISPDEQQAYLALVGRDVALTLDGRNATFKLMSSSFPTAEAMKKGVGDILVAYEATIDSSIAKHQLKLTNVHYSTIAVYLVNCLLPADPGITINAQNRSYNQSFYQLDFTTGSATTTALSVKQQALAESDTHAVFKTYFFHGINHILTGYDHLLFVSALVLAAVSLWDLVKVVTAFTVAHSITLTLAVFGLIHLSERIVEPLIAASIVFVALQNIFWPGKSRGNRRLLIAFLFGLFHGLGFASGLLQIMHQMNKTTVITAILAFSFGIEAGNQLVLLPLFGVLKGTRKLQSNGLKRERLTNKIRTIGSAVIAIAGTCYLYVALIG